jgi:hypothetical protein
MSKGLVSIGLRVEATLRDELAKAAREDGRSMSSLIERVLMDWLREQGRAPKRSGPPPARKRRSLTAAAVAEALA